MLKLFKYEKSYKFSKTYKNIQHFDLGVQPPPPYFCYMYITLPWVIPGYATTNMYQYCKRVERIIVNNVTVLAFEFRDDVEKSLSQKTGCDLLTAVHIWLAETGS